MYRGCPGQALDSLVVSLLLLHRSHLGLQFLWRMQQLAAVSFKHRLGYKLFCRSDLL